MVKHLNSKIVFLLGIFLAADSYAYLSISGRAFETTTDATDIFERPSKVFLFEHPFGMYWLDLSGSSEEWKEDSLWKGEKRFDIGGSLTSYWLGVISTGNNRRLLVEYGEDKCKDAENFLYCCIDTARNTTYQVHSDSATYYTRGIGMAYAFKIHSSFCGALGVKYTKMKDNYKDSSPLGAQIRDLSENEYLYKTLSFYGDMTCDISKKTKIGLSLGFSNLEHNHRKYDSFANAYLSYEHYLAYKIGYLVRFIKGTLSQNITPNILLYPFIEYQDRDKTASALEDFGMTNLAWTMGWIFEDDWDCKGRTGLGIQLPFLKSDLVLEIEGGFTKTRYDVFSYVISVSENNTVQGSKEECYIFPKTEYWVSGGFRTTLPVTEKLKIELAGKPCFERTEDGSFKIQEGHNTTIAGIIFQEPVWNIRAGFNHLWIQPGDEHSLFDAGVYGIVTVNFQ